VAIVVSTCLTQIFAVALHRYAATGEASGPFSGEELQGAVGRSRLRAGRI
jgi:hypothetical protein